MLIHASLMQFTMPSATNDFTYNAWDSGTGAGPVAPPSLPQEIEESVQLSNQYMPLNTVDPLSTLRPPPADFRSWLQQNYPMIPLPNDPNPPPSVPLQRPSTLESFIPVVGSTHNYL